MRLTFEIVQVIIIEGQYGADKVSLCTTDSSPIPDITEEPLCFDFAVARGRGFEYVCRLGIPESLIEIVRI